jgi:hypothetical protein
VVASNSKNSNINRERSTATANNPPLSSSRMFTSASSPFLSTNHHNRFNSTTCSSTSSSSASSPPLTSASDERLPATSLATAKIEIPQIEKQKIESFYRSFGTLLHIGNSNANLYTIQNAKIKPKGHQESCFNRNSIATTSAIKLNETVPLVDEDTLIRDFLHDKYKNHISVYHRGVPLWLFNTGTNPRRPCRQLKFTLAELGTGFIMYQDRIDSHSGFKLYLLTRPPNRQLTQYVGGGECDLDSVDTAVFLFKASDKKTFVLVKFDLNLESIKFYDYYKSILGNLLFELKQRAKSLPISAAAVHSHASSAAVTTSNHLKLTRLKKSSNDLSLVNRKKAANGENVQPPASLRLKRITKSEISPPCNLMHIINITPAEKDLYYTLSKLLPFSSTKQQSATMPVPASAVFSFVSPTSSVSNANENQASQVVLANSSSSKMSSSASSSSSSSACSLSAAVSPVSPLVKVKNPSMYSSSNNNFEFVMTNHEAL